MKTLFTIVFLSLLIISCGESDPCDLYQSLDGTYTNEGNREKRLTFSPRVNTLRVSIVYSPSIIDCTIEVLDCVGGAVIFMCEGTRGIDTFEGSIIIIDKNTVEYLGETYKK